MANEKLMDMSQALDILRLDNYYNNNIIQPLLEALPTYIETTTGLTPEEQLQEPLAFTVSGFLLQLWYNAEGTDVYRLQQVIDSLLKTLSFRKKAIEKDGV